MNQKLLLLRRLLGAVVAGTGRPFDTRQEPGTTLRSARWLAAAALALGLAGTAAGTAWQAHLVDAAARTKFDRGSERLEAEVVRRFRQPMNALKGARGAYAASFGITRSEFRAYVDSRDVRNEFPGVRGFGFIERVQRGDLARFIARERADGAPDFDVETSGDADDLFVVKYLEPSANNRPAIGLDLGRERNRREAAERAMRSGRPALSGRITLRQDKRGGAGLLYLLPVYRNGANLATDEQREAALVGLLYTPIVMSEFMQDAAGAADNLLDLALFDGDVSSPGSLLFDSDGHVDGAAPSKARLFDAFRSIEVDGRRLLLRIGSTPAFEAGIDRSPVAVVGAVGLVASLLMALTVWLLASGRQRAQNLARRMTLDLDRLARVARHTSNAVTITDARTRIQWVNEGFTRITGYSLAEAQGRTPGELLGSGCADPRVLQNLADSAAAGKTCRVEIINRAKGGREYWIDTEVQPTRDAQGALTGFIEVGTDITELKHAQQQLESALRDTDALLRTLHQHAIVSVADRHGRILEVNEAFCRVSGYRRDELLGQDHRIVNSGLHPAAFWADMWRTIAGGAPWRGEICNRAKDGTLYWVDSMLAPFTGADGRIEKYVSIRTDITASKAAQQHLKETAERLALAVDSGSIGLWDWMDVRVPEQWWSASYYALLGYADGEIPSTVDRFETLVHPDHLEACRRAGNEAMTGGKAFDLEYPMLTKAGSYRWTRTRARAFFDAEGRAIRVAGSVQDIHDRKLAEEALEHERRRLRDILEGTNVATWEWNVQTGETHLSERWAEMIGYTLAELGAASTATWSAHTHPEDLAKASILLDRHFEGRLPYYECELRMRHRDGHWIWVLDRGKLFSREADGRPRWMAGTYMDITQRKQAEQALRASESFLDRAGRIAGVGGWQLDLASGELTWTPQTYRIHEVDAGFVPTMGGAIDFYAPMARLVIERSVQAALEKGTPYDQVLPFITARGNLLWVRTVGEVEREDGHAVRLIGAIQDVTERHTLDEQLRRSNALMTGVLENLPCGLAVFDGELQLVAHNTQFRQLLDLPDGLFAGDRVGYDDILRVESERSSGPGDADDLLGLHGAGGDQASTMRFERVLPGGRPLEIARAPLPGGGFVTICVDIGDRKRSEAELQRSEALLRGAIDTVNEAFVLYDPDDRLVFCNDKYRELYAASADLIVPGARFEHIVRAGAERGQYREAIGRVDEWVAERLAFHHMASTALVQRLGDGRWLRIAERKMADGHIVGFRIDITDLMSAKQAAEAASQAKSQFLANMSHEIRTPMNAILGMLRLLQNTGLSPRQLDYATKTEGAARSLLALLNDILDFSKVEAGKMPLDLRPFRVDRLLRDLSAILAADLGRRPIALRLDTDPSVPAALIGDDLRLRQVLLNLAGNAIKFTPEGEVLVSLRVVEAGDTDVLLEFAVRDTGIGIAPEHQAHIFDGFSQAEASTSRRFGGTGLGLAICQRLVALMGGQIGLESAPGRGSRFHFQVRLARATAADAERLVRDETAPLPPSRRLAGLRLLVVEDNANNRQVAQELLAEEGAAVALAEDGAAGVAAVAAATPPFDAVLMDLQMPVMDGYAATALIRARAGAQSLPIIAMTANAMSTDREACLAAGMNDHVGKPFDLDSLVATLLRHCGRPAVARASAPSTDVAAAPAPSPEPGIDSEQALLRLGGHRDVYVRLLRSFMKDLPALPGQLDTLLAQGDVHGAGQLMHTVKGLAGTLGARALAAVTSQFEKQFADGARRFEAEPGVGRLRDTVATTLQDLAQVANRLAPPARAEDVAPRPDPAALRRLLAELGTLLRTADLRALEVFEQLRRDHAAALGGALPALDEAIAALDFARAVPLCQTLANAHASG